jgi:hypothetical protein
VSATPPLFRFVQVELPWALGPPDGRYLLRPHGEPESGASHVIVLATLGAPERRRMAALRRPREAPPEPPPVPVTTGRATVIEAASPLPSAAEAEAWLATAGEPELHHGLEVLNRVLHAFRLVSADPHQHTVARGQALVARVGFGAGEQVADGLWTQARELVAPTVRQRRSRVLTPQARLAAVLGARERMLVTEELTLRARLDLDQSRLREAALQVLVALDAALAELPRDPAAPALTERLDELRSLRKPVTAAAQSALAGALSEADRETVVHALGRIEAALRARAAQGA